MSVSVCLSVCMSVCSEHISGIACRLQTSPNLLCMLPVAGARSSSGGIQISYVFPVLWMTSRLPIVSQTKATKSRRMLKVAHFHCERECRKNRCRSSAFCQEYNDRRSIHYCEHETIWGCRLYTSLIGSSHAWLKAQWTLLYPPSERSERREIYCDA